jgi:uracil-DNA glycosylase
MSMSDMNQTTPPTEDLSRAHRKELVEVVRELRWLLTGFRMAGIRDFPRPLAQVIPQQKVDEPRREPPAECLPEGVRDHAADTPAALAQGGSSALPAIREDLGDCKRCRLHTDRTHIVFGEGPSAARLVFVGEGPGYDEDRQGRPFVGRAGKLLDKMIAALGFERKAVYICNAVKCRPPNNRTPNADEIDSCSPFLFRQLEAIRPDVICALGLTAAQALLGAGIPMNRLRGRTHAWRGIALVCTYHPAYLLRSPQQKAAAWQDLLMVERLLRARGIECSA